MENELDLLDPFRKKKNLSTFMEDFFEPIRLPKEISARAPLVDIIDKGKFLKIIAELPGIEKKNIDLNITDSSLSIRGSAELEKKEEKKGKGYYFHERAYQSFFRQLPLPSNVIPEKAKAEFKNGILSIELPKRAMPKELKKPTKIKVK